MEDKKEEEEEEEKEEGEEKKDKDEEEEEVQFVMLVLRQPRVLVSGFYPLRMSSGGHSLHSPSYLPTYSVRSVCSS